MSWNHLSWLGLRSVRCFVLEATACKGSVWLYLLPKSSTEGTAASLLVHLCMVPALLAHWALQNVFQPLRANALRMSRACLVEVKRPNETLSNDQKNEINFLRSIGLKSRVFRLVEIKS